MTIEQLTSFFGWCAIVGFGIQIVSSLFLMFARGWVMGLHSKMAGVSESELPGMYMNYLGNLKIAVIVLSIVPWLALKLMA